MFDKILNTCLRTYVVNYPLIYSIIGKSVPIVLQVDEENLKNMLRELVSIQDIIINEDIGIPAMKKKIVNSNSRGIFMILRSTGTICKKNIEKLKVLQSIAEYGVIDDCKIVAATFLLCCGRVPQEMGEHITIRIDNVKQNSAVSLSEVIPNEADIPVVLNKLRKLNPNKSNYDALLYSVEFLNPELLNEGSEENYLGCVKRIEEIINDAEEQDEDLVNLFITFFIYQARAGKLPYIYDLPELESDIVENLNSYIYRSGSKLYMAEKLFVEICDGLTKYTSSKNLKEALKEADILRTYSNGYVVKMNYVNCYGATCRASMMEFNMDLLVDSNGDKLVYHI